VAKIPLEATLQVSAAAGVTPGITINAPGPSCSFVIDAIHSRVLNAGVGGFAYQLQITDSSGLRQQWVTSTYAPAGQLDTDDMDLEGLGLVIQAGSFFTVAWSAAVPAGGAGDLSVTFHLAG
jgi:hypothetical protein